MNENLKKRLIKESTYPYTLTLLLENEDLEKAKEVGLSALKAIAARLKKLNSLINGLPSGAYKSGLQKVIDDGMGETVKTLFDTANKAGESGDLANSAKEIGVIASEAEEASTNISKIVAVNTALMEKLSSIILKSGLQKGSDKDIPLIQILDEAGLANETKKELQKAFKEAAKSIKSGDKGGFFANLASKVLDFFDPMKALKDNVDGLIDGILELTPVQIGKFAMDIVNYGKQDEQEADKIEKEAEQAAEQVKDEAAGDEDGDEGEDNSTAEPRPDFDLLAFIKKNYPDLAKTLEDKMAANPDAEEKVEDLDKQIEDGKLSPEDVIEDLESATSDAGSKTINKDEFLKKVEKNKALGFGGKLIVQRMIDAGLFDDFGIKVERAIENYSLGILVEKALPTDDLTALIDLVKEEQPEIFKDEPAEKVLDSVNDFFAEEDIDIQLEVPKEDDEKINLEDLQDEALAALEDDESELVKAVESSPEDLGIVPEELLQLIRPFPELKDIAEAEPLKSAQDKLEDLFTDILNGDKDAKMDQVVNYFDVRDKALSDYFTALTGSPPEVPAQLNNSKARNTAFKAFKIINGEGGPNTSDAQSFDEWQKSDFAKEKFATAIGSFPKGTSIEIESPVNDYDPGASGTTTSDISGYISDVFTQMALVSSDPSEDYDYNIETPADIKIKWVNKELGIDGDFTNLEPNTTLYDLAQKSIDDEKTEPEEEEGIVAKVNDAGNIVLPPEAKKILDDAGIKIEESIVLKRWQKLAGIK